MNKGKVWFGWFVLMLTVIVLGPLGYALSLAKPELKAAGQAWAQTLISLSYVCLVAAILGVVLMVAIGLKHLLRYEFTEIGQYGTIAQRFTKLREVKPWAPQTSVSEAPKMAKVNIEVPTVTDLLKSGAFGTVSLLFGYDAEKGLAVWGSWSDINTFCVAGKSRSGKTITLFFLILQALLNQATVWIADPHGAGRKQSALKKLLDPLSQFVRFACTPEDIAEMCDEFIDIMQARIEGRNDEETPHLFVCDEFNGAAEDNPRLYELVNRCAREWAGVQGYAAIAGHEWTQSGKASQGLAKMRRNLHAKFVHRLEPDYARYLVSGKWVKQTEHLRTGYNIFVNREGDVQTIVTPLGKVQDAVSVSEMLRQIAGPELVPAIEETAHFKREMDGFNPEMSHFTVEENERETDNFRMKMLISPSETSNETGHFTSEYDRKKDKVNKMLGKFTETDIIQTVWDVTAGGSDAFKTAREEFKQMKDELKREAVA